MSSSAESPMLDRHKSTVAQNGQTKHWLSRCTFILFAFLTATVGEGVDF